ncbi:MAG: tryptophan--tRNA ligase [Ignavibacteriae bacterium]|nr:MAG: tryptophan--tRNA ligase [Ignavibacteriota bacterium]
MKKIVLSCIQPSGSLHLGNWLGAIQNWVAIQSDYECIYGLADLHPITIHQDPQVLRHNTEEMTLDLLATGIEPSNLFFQSCIPEHALLCWVLGCNASFGQLKRQKQFQEKSKLIMETSSDKFVSGGLFYYPVLQAADILIYHAHYVPVGKDQEQHLELARNVAERFNCQFGIRYFEAPEPLFTDVPKLMSLTSPDKKMSKSAGDKHYIGIFENDESIIRKVRSAKTDCGDGGSAISLGVENLLTILSATGFTDLKNQFAEEYTSGKLQYSVLKNAVAKAIIEMITPFRDKRKILSENREKVINEVIESSRNIQLRAQETVREVCEIVGLFSPFIKV